MMKIERCDKCNVIRMLTTEEANVPMWAREDACNIVRSDGQSGMKPCSGFYQSVEISAKVLLTNE